VMLLAVEQQKKLQKFSAHSKEPIAIIGAACKMPAGANDLASYWALLAAGKDGITSSSNERWNMDDFYSKDKSAPGKMYTKRLGLVDGVDTFDAEFFGIAPKEAERMDPQQRILLETCWHALEHAGQCSKTLSGTRTGVFIGACNQDYTNLRIGIANRLGHETVTPYDGTGTTFSVAAGRIAYTLGLQGPCFTIDTACSSSLVALHLATQSLLSGESDMAICGGVSLILDPTTSIIFSKANMLSADGRCKTFDAKADGYVRGEGCGVVVLKRLSAAEKDGDRIVGLLAGSALNQDGASQGLTAPNENAQAALLREALANAGLKADDIDYIEAHGTGTSLGDPIEMSAISSVFGKRDNKPPLRVGSAKTNIGHTEAASGMAGLIKVLLSMENETIPPHINFSEPSPLIPWDEMSVEIPTKCQPWKKNTKTRYAGVSSFGFSGSNAHIILAEAPAPKKPKHSTQIPGQAPYILPLSAKSSDALVQQAKQLQALVAKKPSVDLASLCAAASTGRNHFKVRDSLVFHDLAELQEQLKMSVNGEETTGCTPANTAFLFSGQGSQYWGMARQLYKREAFFKQTLDQCEQLLTEHMDIGLTELLWGEDQEALNNTRYTQPVLFAVQFSMAKLWQHWGMKPSVVLGHSVGEYVAACIAGVFTVADALKLIAARGRLMQERCAPGGMAVIFKGLGEVQQLLAEHSCRLDIAAINGPDNTVVSGEKGALQKFICALEEQNIRTVSLVVSHAFHSTMMDSMLDEFRDVAQSIQYTSPTLSVISNVTGKMAYDELCSADYWVSHVRSPVNFYQSINTIAENGVNICLEVGPGTSLLAMAKPIIASQHDNPENYYWFSSMGRKFNDGEKILETLAGLYRMGLEVNWGNFYASTQLEHVDLPRYPFQRNRYWMTQHQLGESFTTPSLREGSLNNGHPLLGSQLDIALADKHYFESYLSLESPAYMDEHRLYGVPVVAGASHTSALLQAAGQHYAQDTHLQIRDIAFSKALVLNEKVEGLLCSKATKVQIVLNSLDEKDETLSACMLSQPINSEAKGTWQTHVSAKISKAKTVPASPITSITALHAGMGQDLTSEIFYEGFWEKGYTIGTAFKWLGEGRKGKNSAIRELSLTGRSEISEDYLFYPGLLDACFQVIDRADPNLSGKKDGETLFVPFHIDEFNFYKVIDPSKKLYCYVELLVDSQQGTGSKILSDLWILSDENEVIAHIKGFEARKTTRTLLQATLDAAQPTVSNDQHQNAVNDIYIEQWQTIENSTAEISRTAHEKPLLILVSKKNRSWAQTCFDNGERPVLFVIPSTTTCAAPNVAHFQNNASVEMVLNSDDHWQALWDVMGTIAAGQWQALYTLGLDCENNLERSINANVAVPNDAELYLPLLQCLQQVQKMPASNIVHLACLSRRGHLIEPADSVDPLQRMMWGMLRSAQLELPNISVQMIDIDAVNATTGDQLTTILHSSRASLQTEQLGIRSGSLYVNRLQPMTPTHSVENTENIAIDHEKIILITGGLGGLGLSIAKSCIDKGAKHVALLSRRAPNDEINLTLDGLREHASIYCLQADIGERDSLINALSQLPANRSIGGVVHAAGVLHDGLLNQLTADSFQHVTRPKIQGAWNLHTLIDNTALDFFVMFSSIAATCGSTGQANYAAGNAFLDGLAELRRSQGVTAASIQWGPWGESGMATRLDERHLGLMAARGLEPLSDQRGLEAFHILRTGETADVSLVAHIDWNRYVDALPFSGQNRPAFYRDLLTPTLIKKEEQLIDALMTLPADERNAHLKDYLQTLLAKTLGFKDKRKIKNRDKLFDIGLDSLLAVELKNTLEKSLARSLSATLLFDYPSLEKLVDHLGEGLSSLDKNAQENAVKPNSLVNSEKDEIEGEEDFDEDDIAALLDDSRLDLAESLMEE